MKQIQNNALATSESSLLAGKFELSLSLRLVFFKLFPAVCKEEQKQKKLTTHHTLIFDIY